MREIIRIDDAGDPRIAGFLDIRERDLRRRDGCFIAEGTVVLDMLGHAHISARPFFAESVLILENRLAGLAPILDRFPVDVPLYVVGREVMNAVAGFDMHRGVLALGRREGTDSHEHLLAALPQGALAVAAIGIANHDNIGSIFRNAAAFGADCVLMDETCCDPLYRKALRVSVGSVLKVPYARTGRAEDLLGALESHGFELWGLSPRGRTDIRQIRPAARMALVTGTEGEGLPVDLMRRIRTSRISQAPGLDSLNAATATGIALHAIAGVMGRI